MKKFKFSLQSLLDLRAKKLEEKQIEFGKLRFAMQRLQNELSCMKNELTASKNNLHSLLESGVNIDVSMINSNRQHILQKEIDIEKQNNKIEEHQILMDKKQEEMVEAHKEKTMLEKLKEKKYNEFLKNIDSTERKELDEIGLTKYAR